MVKNSIMYEVNIRQYTKEGTFKAFEKHLERIKELGVDIYGSCLFMKLEN